MFKDEQQRVYVATGILMAAYFGCRPVSMFDTRLGLEDETMEKHTFGLPQYPLDSDDLDSDACSDDNSDSDTDDGVDAGDDEIRTLLWRHVAFIAVPNMHSGKPNIFFAKVTLLHTKGEDKKPHPYVLPLQFLYSIADLYVGRGSLLRERPTLSYAS